jgi:hypothetical protein
MRRGQASGSRRWNSTVRAELVAPLDEEYPKKSAGPFGSEGAMSRQNLVLCAQSVGYGPVSKLLAIAERLWALEAPLTFVGHGTALELASRSHLFAEAIAARADEPQARRAIGAGAAVLSVMDADFARLALESDLPLFVVDSLAWLRQPIPREFLAARRYWVQNFPGVGEHIAGVRPEPSLVGPIVSDRAPRRFPDAPGLVVNLGGYETPYASASDDSGYADFVVEGFLESGLAGVYRDAPLFLGGSDLVDRLRLRFRRSSLRFASLSWPDAAAVRAQAEVVLTAPGLTSTLEAFRSGRPAFFLPPQNFSQWEILERLAGAGLAPCSFQWRSGPRGGKPEGTRTTAERVLAVRAAIRAVAAERSSRRRFAQSLAGIPKVPHDSLACAQRGFFDALGPDGAATVAGELGRFLR